MFDNLNNAGWFWPKSLYILLPYTMIRWIYIWEIVLRSIGGAFFMLEATRRNIDRNWVPSWTSFPDVWQFEQCRLVLTEGSVHAPSIHYDPLDLYMGDGTEEYWWCILHARSNKTKYRSKLSSILDQFPRCLSIWTMQAGFDRRVCTCSFHALRSVGSIYGR